MFTLTVPPHKAHWWQIHVAQVQQYTLSFSACLSHWSAPLSPSPEPPSAPPLAPSPLLELAEADGAHSCSVSSCWVTSSAHRQFTSSCKCRDALQCGHWDRCSVNQRWNNTKHSFQSFLSKSRIILMWSHLCLCLCLFNIFYFAIECKKIWHWSSLLPLHHQNQSKSDELHV